MPIVHIICATLKPDAPEDAIAHAIQSSQVLWETTRLLHQARADRDAAVWEAEALRAEVQKLLGDGASE